MRSSGSDNLAQVYERKLETKLLGLCEYKLEVTQLDLSV